MSLGDVVWSQSECEGKIRIEHVPGGTRLVVDGEKYIAYDLSALKRLAKFDAEHGELLRRSALLEAKIKIKGDRILELTSILNLCKTTILDLKENAPVIVKTKYVEKDSLWHPAHILIEVVLVAIIGGLIYAVAQ